MVFWGPYKWPQHSKLRYRSWRTFFRGLLGAASRSFVFHEGACDFERLLLAALLGRFRRNLAATLQLPLAAGFERPLLQVSPFPSRAKSCGSRSVTQNWFRTPDCHLLQALRLLNHLFDLCKDLIPPFCWCLAAVAGALVVRQERLSPFASDVLDALSKARTWFELTRVCSYAHLRGGCP